MPKRASRIETEERLIAAVGELLSEEGFSALGVNAVARRAGANKALLYRYFDGLDGLLRAYAERGDFWPTADELVPDASELCALPLGERAGVFFRRYLTALRRRPRTVEILAWETVERSELTAHLEAVREETGLEVDRRLTRPDDPPTDRYAFTALAASALHYLLVRRRHTRIFNGLDLHDDATWERLSDALAAMLAGGAAQR